MQVKFELVTYNEVLDKFEPDENIYFLELDNKQEQIYNHLKNSD